MTPGQYHPPFWKNPVIVKEVRTRMRGYRAVLLLTAHLVVLALVIGLAYLFIRSSLTTIGNLEQRRTFGKASFRLDRLDGAGDDQLRCASPDQRRDLDRTRAPDFRPAACDALASPFAGLGQISSPG